MKIESLDHKGRGISKIDGKITFVDQALVGEDVEIIINKSKKQYNEGSVLTYHHYSQDRVKYACPYYKKCGGCHIGHMKYDSQLQFKKHKITNIVSRYLSTDIKVDDIIYDKQFKYRNKLTLQVDNKVGLYNSGTHEVTAISQCLICDDKISKHISKLNKLDLSKVKQFIVRSTSNEVMIIILGDKDINIKPIYDAFDNIVIKDKDYNVVKGHDYVIAKIGKYSFKISLDSFFQVNYRMMQKLYDYIKQLCKDSHEVLDLYCGTGSIGLYISDIVYKVDGIEINPKAIRDANDNKKSNKINNIHFKCSDTKDIKIKQNYDTIIVDPPRSGLNKNIITEIIANNPKKIIYVSCDPMTLVRDLKLLQSNYNIVSITPFDMFPNTYHVECVSLLSLRIHEK